MECLKISTEKIQKRYCNPLETWYYIGAREIQKTNRNATATKQEVHHELENKAFETD